MGQFEITQAQYQRITKENPATNSSSEFVDPQKPIINVTREDAVAFCQALSGATKRNYRLPTEAEWEYACRACTTTPFHFGETITPALVNYDGNYPYANAAKGDDRQQTTPVGSFPPNAWGLYDMHGNVWEWCADEYYEDYNQKPDALKQDGSIAWTQENTNVPPSDSGYHRLRGGSWYNTARYARSANRDWRFIWNDVNGFRVLLSPRTP
jgi:formylglycine-generating enzyme required for sulfatase activity